MRVSLDQHVEQFHRAHAHVLEQLGGTHRIIKTGNHMHVVKAAWQQIHGVEIQSDSGFHNWRWMVFPSEQHYVLWVMRWS